MAIGVSEAFTICNFAYRLLSIVKTKRILSLMNRNNLGEQSKKGFDNFTLGIDEADFFGILCIFSYSFKSTFKLPSGVSIFAKIQSSLGN